MSDELRDFYKNFYQKSQYTGAMGVFHDFYHKRLERNYPTNLGLEILEIGAGYGEHLKSVVLDFNRYVVSDLHLETDHKVLQKNLSDTELIGDARVQFVNCDVTKMPFKDSEFDRVILTCVLHHVRELALALREIRRITKSGGVVSIYLPCDPGMIYRLIRHFASHRKQAKIMQSSLRYIKFIWSLEHINHYQGIVSGINWEFRNDKIHWGSKFMKYVPVDFSIFKILEIRVSK